MTGPIAVTGGTGFIGRHLITALRERELAVRALTRSAQPFESELVTWIPGSLESPAALESLISGATHLIHLAGVVRGNSRNAFLRTNTRATEQLIDRCARLSNPPRILFVSSLAARAPHLSHYASSKHLAERYLKAEASQLEWSIFRPPAVYGPGDTEVRPLFKLAAAGVLPVPSEPRNRIALLHVQDLVEAMLAWLASNQVHGQTLELSDPSEAGYDWHQLAKVLSEHHGRKVRLIRIPRGLLSCAGVLSLGLGAAIGRPVMLSPGKVRELLHPDWTADSSHTLSHLDGHLDWQPRISLTQGLGMIEETS